MTPGTLRDLRNAALTFQARTLETMLGYNPHSPEAATPPVRAKPEPSKLCPYHGSYHPCIWCEKGAPDFNHPTNLENP